MNRGYDWSSVLKKQKTHAPWFWRLEFDLFALSLISIFNFEKRTLTLSTWPNSNDSRNCTIIQSKIFIWATCWDYIWFKPWHFEDSLTNEFKPVNLRIFIFEMISEQAQFLFSTLKNWYLVELKSIWGQLSKFTSNRRPIIDITLRSLCVLGLNYEFIWTNFVP